MFGAFVLIVRIIVVMCIATLVTNNSRNNVISPNFGPPTP